MAREADSTPGLSSRRAGSSTCLDKDDCAAATTNLNQGGTLKDEVCRLMANVAMDLSLILQEHQQVGRVRVVVVEDFEAWRRTIGSILGADPDLEIVHEASDGLEAVEVCGNLRPDLVILDIGLPKIGGLEAARQIREVSPATRILFLSTIPSPAVIREALRIGAAGYIVKKDALRDLLPAVRSAMQDKEFLNFTVLPEPPD
jgi:CheY-like chemotaxis protein